MIGLLLLVALATPLFAQVPLRLYLDADRTGTREAGLAIEQGLRTALDEAGNRLDGHPVEVVALDHRGSTPRSGRHLRQFLADPRALAVFAGLHSPPLLAHRDFVNENGIPVLVPWAAAAPITRPPASENWIFRLSIDDSKAGFVIVRHAVEVDGFRRPYLLLENTGWGQSNERTMHQALEDHGLVPIGTEWFNWNTGPASARIALRKITDSQADVVFLVANAPEGRTFAQALIDLPAEKRLPVRSHWGITGGDFATALGPEALEVLDLKFIQTRFSFLDERADSLEGAVLARAMHLFPEQIRSAADIRAPTGFAHAYDLGRLLVAAARQAGLSGAMARDRDALRRALEELRHPVRGLLKTYERPFRPFSTGDPDAHEALSTGDFAMARFRSDGAIILVE